jgi:enoyl-CoA hydratase
MSIRYEKHGAIARVTFDRPDVRNALDPEAIVRLAEAWRDFAADRELRVAIITGAGDDSFCSGADLARLIPLFTGGRQVEDEWDRRLFDDPSQMQVALIRDFELYKPVVAAVNGHCIAGGMEILQATDIRVAASTATFGLQEAKWGLFPASGSSVRLARQIPYSLAMEILLTGERITAEEAWRIGLVNRVVPPGQVQDEAERYARLLADAGPLAVRKIKESVLKTWGKPLPEALAIESNLAMEVFASRDAREGPRAFKEKRKPNFRGE